MQGVSQPATAPSRALDGRSFDSFWMSRAGARRPGRNTGVSRMRWRCLTQGRLLERAQNRGPRIRFQQKRLSIRIVPEQFFILGGPQIARPHNTGPIDVRRIPYPFILKDVIRPIAHEYEQFAWDSGELLVHRDAFGWVSVIDCIPGFVAHHGEGKRRVLEQVQTVPKHEMSEAQQYENANGFLSRWCVPDGKPRQLLQTDCADQHKQAGDSRKIMHQQIGEQIRSQRKDRERPYYPKKVPLPECE